jgi:hypothetical protein
MLYSEKSAIAAAKELAAIAGEKEKLATPKVVPTVLKAVPPRQINRHVPGRDIQLDWDKFTLQRQSLIADAVNNKIKWPLYAFGEVGIGKTFLAAAMYMGWAESSSPIWMSYTQFCERCERLRDGRGVTIPHGVTSRDYSSFEEWWRYLAAASVVVIDDFGILDDLGTAGNLSSDVLQSRRYRNEWAIELLDQRLNKPLILTGNLAVENTVHNNRLKSIYEVFDNRLISRLKAGRPIELHGSDLRMADYSIEAIT